MTGKRVIAFVTLVLVFFVFFSMCETGEAVHRIVKVGYMKNLNFMEGDSNDDIKSGYGYEYMQKLSYYTGWEYEYVYGQWMELMEKLQTGEIDILAGVSITDERLKKMNFLDQPMGQEGYYIFTEESADHLTGDGYKYNLAGCVVGCVGDSMQEFYLRKWNAANGNPCEIVTFKGNKDMWKAYDEGRLWGYATVDNNVTSQSGMVPVAFLGAEPYFLAINKNRLDLLQEGNEALNELRITDPFFNIKLHERFLGDTAVMAMLTDSEKACLEKHEVVRVGYLDYYKPFSYTDNLGEPAGAVIEAIKKIAERFNLKLDFRKYSSVKMMEDDLQEHKLDIMVPVYSDAWTAEVMNILETNAIFDVTMNIIYTDEMITSPSDVIAISENSPIQYHYVKRYYPNNPIIGYADFNECIKAVKRGEAKATIVNSYLSSVLLRSDNLLKSTELSGRGDFSIGVYKGDYELVGIFDKGIRVTGRQDFENMMLSNAQRAYQFSIYEYLTARWQLILSALMLLMGIATMIFVRYSHKMQRKNMELEEYKEKLEFALKRAEAGSKAKTSFLYNMSHDIRTPMNAIMGFAELAHRLVKPDSQLDNYMTNIKNAGDSLLTLINNVLDVARIENGKMTLDESVHSIVKATDNIRAMNTVTAEKKGLEFTVDVDYFHEAIYIDHAKTQEIFLNIVSNSIKYTPSGSIKVKFTQLPTEDPDFCIIESIVEDTGIGMSEEFQQRLFDSFEREKNTTASGIQGTGLGMAIVKHLVDLMNGTIEVESALGKGTKITVKMKHRLANLDLINHDEDVSDDKNNESSSEGKYKGKRILLAEDNEFNAEIAVEILEDAGFKVEHAEDGVVCVDMLEKAEAGHYDVILMDIQMPNMDGLRATQHIRRLADKARADIPIIAMTANAFDEDKNNAFKAGMNGFVPKPIELENLFEELERIL